MGRLQAGLPLVGKNTHPVPDVTTPEPFDRVIEGIVAARGSHLSNKLFQVKGNNTSLLRGVLDHAGRSESKSVKQMAGNQKPNPANSQRGYGQSLSEKFQIDSELKRNQRAEQHKSNNGVLDRQAV